MLLQVPRILNKNKEGRMLCPTCNTPNRDDAKFCKKCGHSFHTEAVNTLAAGGQANIPSASGEAPLADGILACPPAARVFTASVWNECPHFLQNLASSRFGVLHVGQSILPSLFLFKILGTCKSRP